MSLKVYNTLTGRKEEFVPDEGNRVNMYVCGVTVYDYCHLGHARAIVAFDALRRYLIYKGYKVHYIQNFTDVDDKIIARANELGEDYFAFAQRYIDAYFEDIDPLNVMRADDYPRVTQYIPDIIEMVKGLIEKGYAYVVDGDVYYSVRKFKDYGKLSKKNIDELVAGARIEPGDKKRDPLDFALWKKSKPNEPSWESPWGLGRPGWHIECSVMSMKKLGHTLTIHGGGQDLIFPHHENEIAQSEAYTCKPFARYWLHNGFVTINREKMSKSLGNFFTLRELYKKFSPLVLRLFLLGTHYRNPLNYSEDAIKHAQSAYQRVYNAYKRLKEYIALYRSTPPAPSENSEKSFFDADKYIQRFEEAMDDDFNTARGLGVFFEFIKELNEYLDNYVHTTENYKFLHRLEEIFQKFDSVLALLPKTDVQRQGIEKQLLQILIDVRDQARKEKNFKLADEIRNRLQDLGIILKDLPNGTIAEYREK